MKKNAVVVTGLGVISPLGITLSRFWEALLSGRSAAAPVRSFDASVFRNHIASEVHDFRPQDLLSPEEIERTPRGTQMALAAAQQALQDAGLDPSQEEEDRFGVAMGSSIGEQKLLQKHGRNWLQYSLNGHRNGTIHLLPCSRISMDLADRFGLAGPNAVLFNSCASSNYALASALGAIRSGQADCMLAGAADSLAQTAFAGFSSLRLLTDGACRPFDKNRRGFFLGEGAAVLVLESLQHARRRGARILCEFLGAGITSDAYHFLAPHIDGKVAVLERTLQDARTSLDDVSYINAHGNATLNNDRTETRSIKRVFGPRAAHLPVSSIKALTGHCMAASSAFEAVACILAIQNSLLPPTWNLETPDPECDLDYVAGEPREQEVKVALSNSFAFGGANSTVAFGRFEG